MYSKSLLDTSVSMSMCFMLFKMKMNGKNEIKSSKKAPFKYLSAIFPISLIGYNFSSDLNSIKKLIMISIKKQNSTSISDHI